MGKQADAIVAQLTREAEKACKALTLEVTTELIKATPVDTGHARANYVPSVGSPAIAEVSDSSAHDAGVQAVIRFKLADGALFVSNNTPYLPMLNLGHSKQAPVGFIEAAIDQALATIQQRYASVHIELGGNSSTSDAYAGMMAENVASAYLPEGVGIFG